MTKLCKDCKHYSNLTVDICNRPHNHVVYNPVTGDMDKGVLFCKIDRFYNILGSCGPDGVYYAEKVELFKLRLV